MTRILCVGDRQIGVGTSPPLRPGERLADQELVGHRIVDLALERDVDLILDGGDVFEGPEVNDEHREAFIRPLERLDGRIPIVVCLGNGRHDRSTKPANALQTLRHVPGLIVCSSPQVVEVADALVAVVPWVHSGLFIATHGRGDTDELNARIVDLLIQIAENLRAECAERAPERPALLLLHWSISGASLPTGLRSDAMSEPVLHRGDLEQLDFAAVVASHIHVPQMLWANGRGIGLYTGSPMPHDFGEEHTEHGVWIVETAGATPTAEFVPVPSRPFVTLDLDADQLGGDVVPTWEITDGAIVRVRYTATREQQAFIDTAHVRETLLDAGAAVVKIVPEIMREDRARVAGLDEQVGELDALEQWMVAQGIVGVDEPWELAEPTRLLAEAMRAKTAGYLERV